MQRSSEERLETGAGFPDVIATRIRRLKIWYTQTFGAVPKWPKGEVCKFPVVIRASSGINGLETQNYA
jgi:hypothetical protein